MHRQLSSFCLLAAAATSGGSFLAAQDTALSEELRRSAHEAIGSETGGVFVVEVHHTYQLRRSRVFAHVLGIEEVLKPYRNRDRIHWIPLEVNELTSDRVPTLKVGRRYLVVTSLMLTPYGRTYVEGCLELGPGDEKLLEPLREVVARAAVYGSSPNLDALLQAPFGFDARGFRTPFRDGRLDPAAFGLSEEVVRGAAKRKDMELLVVRCLDAQWNAKEDCYEGKVLVIEDLLERGRDAGDEVRVELIGEGEDLAKEAAKVTPPYVWTRLFQGYTAVFLLERREGGLPILRTRLPVAHEEGPTVQTIRGWLGAREKDGDMR